MKIPHHFAILAFGFASLSAFAREPLSMPVWPGRPPGEISDLPPEADTTRAGDQLVGGRRVIRLGNVSTPTLTVYRPAADKDTGATVLVCPGGGYHILAMDLEGIEVCAWLNSIGVTGVLLKYRVPARPDRERYAAPLEDAQRALGLVRERAESWGLDPHRIGVLGFSAGGHLAAMLGDHPKRTYEHVDRFDAINCHPDFVILIYPAYLVDENRHDAVTEELLPEKGLTPPTFLAMAEDDPIRVENPLSYYFALKHAGIPVEMHLYPTGGHGYGLRRTNDLVTTWPDRVADWLAAGGWLTPTR